jgi:galactonate dehydratase
MKIAKLETLRIEEFPNLLWLSVHSDEGIVGLGETFLMPRTVEAYLHEVAAPKVLGRDPLAIDRIAKDLVGYLGFRSTGAEMRGNSALDIALWDLFGKAVGQPLAQLLGGFSRESIRTYNTCAGPVYMRKARGQQVANWGLKRESPGRYDDLDAFLNRADELAEDLISEGITAMKIWPFDPAAEKSDGQYISRPDLKSALEPFEKIRRAVGDRMDVMVEFHSLWQLVPAMTIAKALAPFATFWHEDPIKMDSLANLVRYAAASPAPICASETLGSIYAFRDLLETGAAGVIMFDIAWCGGISEARKIAAMAEAWRLSVAPHDCTGPVTFAASTHLSLHAPNALVQESVRAYYRTWYRDLVAGLPEVKGGEISVARRPGHGVELHSDLARRHSVEVRTTALGDI